MHICNYCGRVLKHDYEKCPGCGGSSFKNKAYLGEEIIKTPPKDGYKVNLINFKYEKKFHWVYLVVGAFMFVFISFFMAGFISPVLGDDVPIFFTYVFIAFAVFAFLSIMKAIIDFIGKSNKIRTKSNNDIKKAEYLSKNGMLIKNLKYEVKPVVKNIDANQTVYIIQVIYEIEKGKTNCFKSEPKYLTALGRDDGTVDLLIDPNNYDNYFIDFEIY